jgi:hypothetical protein
MTAPPRVRAIAAGAPRLVIVGLILVAGALILFDCMLATSDRPTLGVIWGGLAFACYAAGLMCVLGERYGAGLGLAGWKIGPWTLLWYSVAFGVTTVTWSRPQNGVPTEIILSSVLRALWLVAGGVTAWAAGYLAGPGRLIRRAATRALSALCRRLADEVRSRSAPWLLYAIGVAARLAGTATTGRFGYVGDVSGAFSAASSFGGVLGALSLCAPLAVSAAAFQVFREGRRNAWITLVVLFLVELAFGAAAGGKQNFVIAVLAVVIPFCASGRRMPKTALIVTGLIFLVVVIPFNQAYRDVARQGTVTLTPRQAIAAAPSIFEQTVTNDDSLMALPNSISYFAQRIRDIDNVAIIVQRTPGQISFQSPIQLVEDPIAGIVPRAIWPSKPIADGGYEFSQEFFDLPSTTYTSSSDTLVGGLYWYGGWIPVIAGMFLVGCGVRLLDDVVDVQLSPQGSFLVLLLFPSLVRGEYDWQSIITSLPATMFVWLVALFVIFRRRRLV